MTKVGERWSMVTSTPFLAKSTEIFRTSAGFDVEDTQRVNFAHIMARGAGTNDERLLALPLRSRAVSAGVNDLPIPSVLPRERRWHLWLAPTKTSRKDNMRHLELPLLLGPIGHRTENGHVPLLRPLVEGGTERVELGLAPRVDLEDVDVGFEEVGEFACGSEDGPVGWEGEEGEVVGVDGVVQG